MQRNNFPKEYYIELAGNPDLEGRVVIFLTGHELDCYRFEIDIVTVENKKIWKHIGSDFSKDFQEALDLSVQRLANFVKKPTA